MNSSQRSIVWFLAASFNKAVKFSYIYIYIYIYIFRNTKLPLHLNHLGQDAYNLGQVAYIYVSTINIIGSDSGLSPVQHQSNKWTNVGILLIGTLGIAIQWNFTRNEYIFIQEKAFENVVCIMASISSRPQCVSRQTCSHFSNTQWFSAKCSPLTPITGQRGRNTGPRFNIKMSSYQYRKSHCGDKTVVRSSYLHNGISYTGKMSSLYWIGAQMSCENRTISKIPQCSKYPAMHHFVK